VIVLDGQLIEVLHVAEAQRILDMAERISAPMVSAGV
jgi:citrate lyase beta subunit